VGCGRGGPGLWLAQQLGARLTGVDFSPVGVAHARERGPRFLAPGTYEFVVADAAATGLADGCADAIVCLDVFQVLPEPAPVAAEMRRLLRPGGPFVLTTWEWTLGPPGQIEARLREADFSAVLVEEQPDWLARERRIYQRAL